MKNYNVKIDVPVTFEFSVDANSREEALKKLFEEKAYSDCRINT